MAEKIKGFADGKRKRPKTFYINQNKRKKFLEALEPGLSGFLITCNTKNEKFAVFEAYSLLNEYADALYGPEVSQLNEDKCNEVSEADEDESIEEALNKEIESIKDLKKQERRFQSVKTGVKNVLFIKTTLPDPNELVYKIFSDLQEKGIKKTRHCLRLLPVKFTSYASMDKIKKHFEPIIDDEFLGDGVSPIKFYVQVKSRCSGAINKEDILRNLSKIILDGKKGHQVDYNHPDWIINIDIVRNVCLFGILKDFSRFKKYNLHSIVEVKTTEEKIDKEENGNISVVDHTIDEHEEVSCGSINKTNKEVEKESKSQEEVNGTKTVEEESETEKEVNKSVVDNAIDEHGKVNIDSSTANKAEEKERVNAANDITANETEQGDDVTEQVGDETEQGNDETKQVT